MQMICFMQMEHINGSTDSVSIIRIPMEQAVPYPVQSPQILQKDIRWKKLWNVQRITFRAH